MLQGTILTNEFKTFTDASIANSKARWRPALDEWASLLRKGDEVSRVCSAGMVQDEEFRIGERVDGGVVSMGLLVKR